MDGNTPKKISKQAIETEFEGHDVCSPDGRFIVIRVLTWAGGGQKWTTRAQASVAWNRVKQAHPEFVSLTLRNSTGRRGAPVDTLDEEGMYQLLMVLDAARAVEFRSKAARLVREHREGARGQPDRFDPKWTQARADSKDTFHPLNNQIHDCGGTNDPKRNTYAVVHARNNRLATGKSMQTLRRQAGNGPVRDSFSTPELGKLITVQHLETKHLQQTKPHGHEGIVDRVLEVTEAFGALIRRFEGEPERLPPGTPDTFAPAPAAEPVRQLPPKRTAEETATGKDFFARMKAKLGRPDDAVDSVTPKPKTGEQT